MARNAINQSLVALDMKYLKEIPTSVIILMQQNCRQIRILHFLCSDVSEDVLLAIAHHCPLLKILMISECEAVNDKVLTAIANGYRHLEDLNIGKCLQVSDVGVIEVAENCTALESLWLSDNNITDASIYAIAEHLHKLLSYWDAV